LVNHARAFLFTTAAALPVAAAARAAVELAASSEGDRLRDRLHASVIRLRTLLALPPHPIPSPILPIILGSETLALDASATLRAAGFLLPAIRPPTVRPGTSRLRITLSAQHTEADLASLACALKPILDPRPAITISAPAPRTTPAPASRLPQHLAPPRGIVIVGTDTGVGKSTFAAALLHLLSRRGLAPVPFKPVETGADPHPRDALLLLEASQRPDLPLDLVCPFPFPLPIAPAAAAAHAGVALCLSQLLAAAAAAAAHGGPLIVETAGGLLSPYGEHFTSSDLAAALRLPVVLVSRNALGTVNHTALALAEIRRRCLPLAGVLLVDTSPPTTPDRQLNANLIASLSGITPLGTLPYLPSPRPPRVADALETSVDLRPVLDALT
jgi:dethiobiotin synthetase